MLYDNLYFWQAFVFMFFGFVLAMVATSVFALPQRLFEAS